MKSHNKANQQGHFVAGHAGVRRCLKRYVAELPMRSRQCTWEGHCDIRPIYNRHYSKER